MKKRKRDDRGNERGRTLKREGFENKKMMVLPRTGRMRKVKRVSGSVKGAGEASSRGNN